MARHRYIAHYEVCRRAGRGISKWEDKEFSNYLDAEYFCAKWKTDHPSLGAVVHEVDDRPKRDPDLARAERTVDCYVDRMFASGRIF